MARKPKTPAGQPKVKISNGRLQIVLTYRGVRKYLSLGLPSSKANLAYADAVRSLIASDLLNDNFDPTLEKYKRDALRPDSESEEGIDLSLLDLWGKYTSFKRTQLSPSTLAKDFKRVISHIEKFPSHSLDGAVGIRNHLIENSSPATAKKILTQLSSCCRWAVESRLVSTNPFEGMASQIKAPKRSGDEDIDPFSIEERDAIVGYLQRSDDHYSYLVEFLFRCGARPSEAIALQWRHISDDFSRINFEQAIVDGEDGLTLKQGLKTQQRRVFPCGEGLSNLLRSMAPARIDRSAFVFASPTGKLIDFHNFSNRVWHPTLKSLGIRSRCPYQMRHSFITFCVQSGMNPKDVAILVGNSPEIIFKHYLGATRNLIAPDF